MSVEDRVQKIVCEQLGVSSEEVKLEASFIDDARISTQLEKNHMFHKRDRQICCQNICHILKW